MAKDPAFLFYSDNFMSGTMFLSDEQVGRYIRLLCAQHLTGHLNEKDMLKICKTRDEDIWNKFILDEDGKYYNLRLEIEINKRKSFSESRSNNRLGKVNKNKKQVNNISKSSVKHLGNENEIENVLEKEDNKGVQGEFKLFKLSDLKKYFDETKTWRDKLCIANSLQPTQLSELFNQFTKDQDAKEMAYSNRQDATTHFANWLKTAKAKKKDPGAGPVKKLTQEETNKLSF